MNKQYFEDVMNYLEYLNFPEYVMRFEPSDVARSTAKAILICQQMNFSYRMCALSIFGLTWEYQIARIDSNETIN